MSTDVRRPALAQGGGTSHQRALIEHLEGAAKMMPHHAVAALAAARRDSLLAQARRSRRLPEARAQTKASKKRDEPQPA